MTSRRSNQRQLALLNWAAQTKLEGCSILAVHQDGRQIEFETPFLQALALEEVQRNESVAFDRRSKATFYLPRTSLRHEVDMDKEIADAIGTILSRSTGDLQTIAFEGPNS